MFTIFVQDDNVKYGWSTYGVYDINNVPTDLFEKLDIDYTWYARPDTYEAEQYLHDKGII